MAYTKNLTGLRPAGGHGPGGGFREHRVGAFTSLTMGYGTMMKIAPTGVMIPVAASTDTPAGVAVGFRYNDSVTKKVVHAKFIVSGTSSAPDPTTGESMIFVQVVDGEDARFVIQADATISVGDINFHYSVTGNASVDSNTGYSLGGLTVASRSSAIADKTLRLVGIVNDGENKSGDAAPLCLVEFARHRRSAAVSLS